MNRFWYCSFVSIIISVGCFAKAADTVTMSLSSDDFLNNMAIPVVYTCDGKDISPELSWTNTPTKAVSLAIIMKDIDAPNGVFYHWGLYNLSASIKSLNEGAVIPNGASVTQNNFDKSGYNGPCPHKGSAHTYIFTLYALDSTITLPANSDAATLEKSLRGHIISQAEYRGVYSRWIK